MGLNEIMHELKSLGKERMKKIYMSNGAKEPVFGVTISDMKPIFKKIKYNQSLAEQLYATGNYDAMYLAGMIAEPKKIAEEVGKIDVFMGKKLCQASVASEYIQNAIDKGNLGFKRKHVRC